jgi:hypothetical protein
MKSDKIMFLYIKNLYSYNDEPSGYFMYDQV